MFLTTTPAFSSSPPQTKPSAVPTTPTTSASLLNCSANNGHVSVGMIPLMAKARIGHFVEAQILEAIGIDYVDESEVLTPTDDAHHINKHNFRVPFVCGCRDLGEALRRICKGAAMIRTKGEAGTRNIIEAIHHVRSVMGDIRSLRNMDDDEVFAFAKRIAAPYDLVMQTKQLGHLPIVHFAAASPSSTSAAMASSSASASSRAATLPATPAPSSRPSPTIATPTSWPTYPTASERPWSGSTSMATPRSRHPAAPTPSLPPPSPPRRRPISCLPLVGSLRKPSHPPHGRFNKKKGH